MSEQPMPKVGGASVTEAIIAFLREREAKGIATYGRSLETFNGRDATRDLLEELIDALQYAMQWRMERSSLLAERDRTAAEVAVLRRVIGDAQETIYPWRKSFATVGWGALNDKLTAALKT